MEKTEKYLLAEVKEKVNRCESRNVMTHTNFLDMHMQELVRKNTGGCLYGGMEDSERKIFMCIPDYIDLDDQENFAVHNPLTGIRIVTSNNSKTLTHRDYLGAILGLGIKREKIGDILVGKSGADIIVLKDIVDFLLSNFLEVGRSKISIEEISLEQLDIQVSAKKEISTTVSSLRLDVLVAAGFGCSRSKAVEAINRGIVFVNNIIVTKTDTVIKENSKITWRGKGKVHLVSIGGKSKKDKFYITLEKY